MVFWPSISSKARSCRHKTNETDLTWLTCILQVVEKYDRADLIEGEHEGCLNSWMRKRGKREANRLRTGVLHEDVRHAPNKADKKICCESRIHSAVYWRKNDEKMKIWRLRGSEIVWREVYHERFLLDRKHANLKQDESTMFWGCLFTSLEVLTISTNKYASCPLSSTI